MIKRRFALGIFVAVLVALFLSTGIGSFGSPTASGDYGSPLASLGVTPAEAAGCNRKKCNMDFTACIPSALDHCVGGTGWCDYAYACP